MEANAEVQAEDIGLLGRMIRVFYAPGETFEAVQQRCTRLDWFVPMLLTALVATAGMQMVMPQVLKAQQEAAAKMTADQSLSDEQRAQQRQAMEKMAGITRIMTLVSIPIMAFAMVFIFGGVYLLIARYALGGEVTYGQMLAVHGYASLIGILSIAVLTPIRQAKDEMIVALGPGLLLGEEMLGTYLGRMINLVYIFMLWQIGVAAIGLSILARAAMGKTLSMLLILWVAYVVIAAAFGGLVPGA